MSKAKFAEANDESKGKMSSNKRYVEYNYYFGDLDAGDVKKIALKVPNVQTIDLRHPCIPPVQMKGYVSVFNDILEEFSVMKCVMNETQDDNWNYLIQYHTLEARYSKLNDEFYDYTNNKNLLRHLCILYNVFYAGFLELLENQSFTILVTAVHDYIHLMHDEALLLDELAANKKRLIDMDRALKKEKKSLQAVIDRNNYKWFKVTERAEDVRAYTNMELRYMNKWENARVDQKLHQLTEKEDYYRDISKEMEHKTQQENRVHNEIGLYTNERIVDVRNEIEFWMDQYDNESDARDIHLGKLRVELEMQTDRLEKLRNEHEFRANFIAERKRIKEERLEAEARRRRELAASIRIQAWWRGVMVRRFLGKKYKKLKKRIKQIKRERKAAAKAEAAKKRK